MIYSDLTRTFDGVQQPQAVGYPRSNPKLQVLGADYEKWRQEIGMTLGWDGEK